MYRIRTVIFVLGVHIFNFYFIFLSDNLNDSSMISLLPQKQAKALTTEISRNFGFYERGVYKFFNYFILLNTSPVLDRPRFNWGL